MKLIETAKSILNADRRNDYGHPLKNFCDIAKSWRPILHDPDLRAWQVAMCMDALKTCRTHNGTPSEDTFVDKIGYASLAGSLYGVEAAIEKGVLAAYGIEHTDSIGTMMDYETCDTSVRFRVTVIDYGTGRSSVFWVTVSFGTFDLYAEHGGKFAAFISRHGDDGKYYQVG